jgi:FkbM family methyltransferase
MIYGKNGKEITVNNEKYIVSAHIARGVSSTIDETPYKILRNLCKNANVVFDIGANVGIISTLIAKSMKPNSLIYSFEPVPQTFAMLKDNARVQKGNAKILAYNLAVSNSVGKIYFTNRETHTVNNILNQPDEKSIEVNSTTVDEFCSQNSITPEVFKVDVEGAEFFVLQGMINTLRKNSCTILMEIHNEMLRNFGVDPQKFSDLLKEIGYNLYNSEGEKITYEKAMNNSCIVLSKTEVNKSFFTI